MSKGNQLYCSIRKMWVAATPEETIRQKIVSYMIEKLGYPPAYLALEKELRLIPHLDLTDKEIPDRRADLICFGKDIHPIYPLFPLLLVEFKAVKITKRTLNQIIGYNHHLKAYFIAVANDEEIRTGWYDAAESDYRFIDNLPSYSQLIEAISKT